MRPCGRLTGESLDEASADRLNSEKLSLAQALLAPGKLQDREKANGLLGEVLEADPANERGTTGPRGGTAEASPAGL